MPGDMAMEWPHPRVICEVLQHDIPRRGSGTRLHELHVTALGVLLVDDCTVPGSDALGQDVEIVAVKMHGVGGREGVLDDDTDRAVVSEVVDIPLGVEWVRDVALVGEDEDGVALEE